MGMKEASSKRPWWIAAFIALALVAPFMDKAEIKVNGTNNLFEITMKTVVEGGAWVFIR